ncbi:MAG: hypothetical protein Q9219_007625 [cf. Caloplaca sp. 3 TL-2023]
MSRFTGPNQNVKGKQPEFQPQNYGQQSRNRQWQFPSPGNVFLSPANIQRQNANVQNAQNSQRGFGGYAPNQASNQAFRSNILQPQYNAYQPPQLFQNAKQFQAGQQPYQRPPQSGLGFQQNYQNGRNYQQNNQQNQRGFQPWRQNQPAVQNAYQNQQNAYQNRNAYQNQGQNMGQNQRPNQQNQFLRQPKVEAYHTEENEQNADREKENFDNAYQNDSENSSFPTEMSNNPYNYYGDQDNGPENKSNLDENYAQDTEEDLFGGFIQTGNFVGIQSKCNKCGQEFASRTKLHKHLKSGHPTVRKDVKLATESPTKAAEIPSKDQNTKEFTPKVSTAPEIIISKAVQNKDIGNNIAFRS